LIKISYCISPHVSKGELVHPVFYSKSAIRDPKSQIEVAYDPETYFITHHYLNYPYILVSLKRVHPDALKELILTSHQLAKPGRNPEG
jgi:hypothetical protein